MATPAASVTTASWTPRIRSAGQADQHAEHAAASRGRAASESGKGTAVPIFDSTKPAAPANAAWASEICPTSPTRTTSDRAMMRDDHRGDHPEPVAAAGQGERRDAGRDEHGDHAAARGRPTTTGGRRSTVSEPRVGSRRPTTNSATTITTNGTAWATPTVAHDGHQAAGRQQGDLGLERAEPQPGGAGGPNRAEPADQCAGQSRARRSASSRAGRCRPSGATRMATAPPTDGRQHPGHRRQPIRRVAEQQRPPLVLRRRPGGQPASGAATVRP